MKTVKLIVELDKTMMDAVKKTWAEWDMPARIRCGNYETFNEAFADFMINHYVQCFTHAELAVIEHTLRQPYKKYFKEDEEG